MERSACLLYDPPSESHTVITWSPGTVAAGSKNVAVPDIVIPHSSGSRRGSGELNYSSREGI